MSLELAKDFMNVARMTDRSQYTDDFTSSFPDGTTLPADVVCSLVRAIVAAGPDFCFNMRNWKVEGDTVTADAQVTTTMTENLSHPELGDVEATNKRAELPVERLTMTFRDGKVASMAIASDAPGGPPEVIKQWTA